MIEFRCDSCEKLLRVGDENAGARAKCPSCGAILLIPNAASTAQSSFADRISASSDATATLDSDAAEGDESTENDESGATKQCPYCCETIKAAASKCRFCGERVVQEDGELPRKFDVGKIIGYAWQVFMKNPALVICTSFVATALPAIFFLPIPFGIVLMAGAGAQQGRPDEAFAVLIAATVLCGMLFTISSCMLSAGMLKVHEKLARGDTTRFGEMFLPINDFGKVMGLTIVLGGMYLLGMAACVVPGVIVLIMYWPAAFFIHDDDCGVIESLNRARKLTDNNWLNSFLVGLIYMAISSSGAMLFYIGMIVTLPLSYLMLAACYVTMRIDYENRHGPIDSQRPYAPGIG